MFVWRGWGIVVVLITFLCSRAAELITEAWLDADTGKRTAIRWPWRCLARAH